LHSKIHHHEIVNLRKSDPLVSRSLAAEAAGGAGSGGQYAAIINVALFIGSRFRRGNSF
jgi:hypothetical protein